MVIAMDEGAVYGSPMYRLIDDAINAGTPETDESENDSVGNVVAAAAAEQTGSFTTVVLCDMPFVEGKARKNT